MSQDVKAVMFKTEFFPALQCLTREQLGAVMQAIMADALGQDMPELDPIEKMAVAMLMPSIRAAQEEYRRKCRAQSENGKKGGRPRKVEVIEEDETETQKSHGFSGLSEKTQKSRIEGNRIEGNIYTPLCSTNICPPMGDVVEAVPAKKSRSKFVKPTVEDVAAYCAERGNDVDPEAFVAFYDSNGWKVGKNPMRDWKGAVRTWEQRMREDQRATIHGNAPRPMTVGQMRYLEEKQAAQTILANKIREREERNARQIGTAQNGGGPVLSLPTEFQ